MRERGIFLSKRKQRQRSIEEERRAMAIIPSSSLQFSNPLFSSPHPPKPLLPFSFSFSFSTTTRASSEPNNATTPEPPQPSDPSPSPPEPESDQFESRLSQIRLRYRSGTGKKAELRKGRKSKKPPSGGVFLPPVPLKEPISGGLKVDFGFSPYSERINGRIAILGLSALLLVELATGKSVISYHSPAIIFIQIYFVAAVSALFVKYEKERVSVWPQSSPKN